MKSKTLQRNQAKTTSPSLNNSQDRQDSRTILFKRSKVEDQHTRRIQ